MEQVRIGVIGVGNVGFMHVTNLYQKKVEGAVLKAVCDIRQQRLALCEERFPDVSCYEDYRELLRSAEVDAVLVSVPHRLHTLIAGEAFSLSGWDARAGGKAFGCKRDTGGEADRRGWGTGRSGCPLTAENSIGDWRSAAPVRR